MIEKLDPDDARPSVLIAKVNEIIDKINLSDTHAYKVESYTDSRGITTPVWNPQGKEDEPRNEGSPD